MGMVILYVSTCITRGTDPCMAASDGRTPFYVACAEGHIDIVKLLCAQKVVMCKADQDGTAPAHIAAACGHLEVIQYLHEQGVSVKHPGSIYD